MDYPPKVRMGSYHVEILEYLFNLEGLKSLIGSEAAETGKHTFVHFNVLTYTNTRELRRKCQGEVNFATYIGNFGHSKICPRWKTMIMWLREDFIWDICILPRCFETRRFESLIHIC